MANNRLTKSVVVVLAALVLAACGSAKPFDYQPTADEMMPGGGLFSGDDGEFVIYGSSPAGPGSPPEGLTGDHENARYTEDDSRQEAPAAD